MAKFVQEALIPLQGETITIKSDGREVIIGDHFAEEFARSNDTAHSYAKNKAVKLNSYPNVRDIVEAGVNPQNNPNAKTQHDEKVNPKKKDASRGWVYYDSPLLVKNGDEYSKYNVVLNVTIFTILLIIVKTKRKRRSPAILQGMLLQNLPLPKPLYHSLTKMERKFPIFVVL